MIWICIEYTSDLPPDHPQRVHHIFRRAWIYRVGERVHVAGTALCRAVFSHDTSGFRVDVISPLIIGVDDDVRLVPMDHCEKCRDELLVLRGAVN